MSDTAIVTGASAGIGEAFSRALASRGMALVLVARDGARLEQLAAELRASGSPNVTVLAADLTEASGLRKTEEAVRTTPGLSLLVNNAGFGTAGPFVSSDIEKEEAEIRLNVLSLVRLCHAGGARLVEQQRGGIINVSSVQGFFPSAYVATYGATKAFVTSFSESLAAELAGTGVVVQALCPGFTKTEFQSRANMKTGDVPRGAWMTPEAVVEASLSALDRGEFLCVPGAQNAALVGLEKIVPRAFTRKITTRLNRRVV